jgi:membrane protein
MAFVQRLGRRAITDRVTGLAAELAFWSVLSLVPIALVFTALLGLVRSVFGDEVAERAQSRVVDALNEALGPGGDGVVRAVEGLFAGTNPGLLSVAVVLALWTGARVTAAVTNALDVVGRVRDRRSWLVRRLWGMVLGVGSLVVITGMLVLLIVLPFGGTTVGGLLVDVLAAGVVVAWVAAVYSMGSSQRRRFVAQLRGAALTAVLVVVFTIGFRLYLAVQPDNVVVFGLGGALVALLWLYLMGLALLIGAEANEVWAVPVAEPTAVASTADEPDGGASAGGAPSHGTAYAGDRDDD